MIPELSCQVAPTGAPGLELSHWEGLHDPSRSRVPSIVRDRLDRALREAISAVSGGDASRALAALERGTRGGDALPRGAPRLHCRMAAGRLRDAAGWGDGPELELDLLEAERCLWAARAQCLRSNSPNLVMT